MTNTNENVVKPAKNVIPGDYWFESYPIRMTFIATSVTTNDGETTIEFTTISKDSDRVTQSKTTLGENINVSIYRPITLHQ